MAIPYSRTIIGGLPWYSVLIVTGILAAILLAEREQNRLGLPKDTVIDLALVAVPCGVVGARLYYVAMTWDLFRQNPISILYIWEGGIAIYGAVIGGAVGAWFYARRKKLSFLRLCDVVAPGLLLAQAIGRWGNYFNMEAYGPEITDPRFQFFPIGVLIDSGDGFVWHMATFFYESLWNAVGFCVLWRLRKKEKQPGNLFCWYLLIYGSGRFIIEQLRQDSLYIGSLRASQWLSLLFCLLAALTLLWRALGSQKRRFVPGAVSAVCWISRWLLIRQPVLYAATLTAALALGLCGKTKWLLAVAAADSLGLACYLLRIPFSPQFAEYLHAVICSATLPVAVGLLKYQ